MWSGHNGVLLIQSADIAMSAVPACTMRRRGHFAGLVRDPRARVGIATGAQGRFLAYVTGGLAYGQITSYFDARSRLRPPPVAAGFVILHKFRLDRRRGRRIRDQRSDQLPDRVSVHQSRHQQPRDTWPVRRSASGNNPDAGCRDEGPHAHGWHQLQLLAIERSHRRARGFRGPFSFALGRNVGRGEWRSAKATNRLGAINSVSAAPPDSPGDSFPCC